MQLKYLKSFFTFKKIALFGCGLGIMLLLIGCFVSDYNKAFFFTALGFGLLAGSVVHYLFGTFISLMDEYIVSSKGKPKMARTSRKVYN